MAFPSQSQCTAFGINIQPAVGVISCQPTSSTGSSFSLREDSMQWVCGSLPTISLWLPISVFQPGWWSGLRNSWWQTFPCPQTQGQAPVHATPMAPSLAFIWGYCFQSLSKQVPRPVSLPASHLRSGPVLPLGSHAQLWCSVLAQVHGAGPPIQCLWPTAICHYPQCHSSQGYSLQMLPVSVLWPWGHWLPLSPRGPTGEGYSNEEDCSKPAGPGNIPPAAAVLQHQGHQPLPPCHLSPGQGDLYQVSVRFLQFPQLQKGSCVQAL